ncbi:hypothetical protein QR680_005079 [Steinernema hermaphroditum]|uniref:Uncharacterized protein n=1 Tax=Steinernema hermaphroditum TaxID=289476 RepID=A0AA39HQS8_9BILA|nr:hypothetical protein QR680_005079 [Steinernema hermaphroditum]
MDTVPYKFVDAVVECFGKDSLTRLAKTVHSTIWGKVIQLHSCNRQYYNVDIAPRCKARFKVYGLKPQPKTYPSP